MKTILLFSPDSGLANRIGLALGGGEEVLRLEPDPAEFLLSVPAHRALVVIDCRAKSRHGTEQAVVKIRAMNSGSYRCVALVGHTTHRRIEVVGRDARHDYDVVLVEHDDVGITIRAILNDVDGSVGVAVAFDGLCVVLEPVALRITGAVLASACRVDGVDRAARALHTDRSALAADLADEGPLVPKNVVSIARATYAVVLLRRTHLSLGKVADRINVSAGRYVQEMLEREFHADAEELMAREPEMEIEAFLDVILTEWSWRNRGGRDDLSSSGNL